MTTIEKIEMTRKNLMSVPGFNFNEEKVARICEENEFIPEGALVMKQGSESVFFEQVDNLYGF